MNERSGFKPWEVFKDHSPCNSNTKVIATVYNLMLV